MSTSKRQHRPAWYFHGVLTSWSLWAIGRYETRRGNWLVRYYALGPLRFRFVRPHRNTIKT